MSYVYTMESTDIQSLDTKYAKRGWYFYSCSNRLKKYQQPSSTEIIKKIYLLPKIGIVANSVTMLVTEESYKSINLHG